MIEQRRVVFGMDTDTDERDVQNGFCRKAVNVRIGSTDGENKNAVELCKGNEIRYIELPSGENTTIGAYEYKRDSLVYYFNHNSEGNHNIVQYNLLQDRSIIVMVSEVLNFSKDHLITHVDIVDLDNENQLIYFVDRINPPRKFNIGKSIRAFNIGLVGDKYDLPITLDIIDAIKYPPLFPPTSQYLTDINFGANYLKNDLWQFKARYVYDDNEKSAFSPISKQTISNTSYIPDTSQFNNFIKIVVPQGGKLVKRLEIVGRPNEISDFISISDKELNEYFINADGDYEYSFYNDGNYSIVDVAQSIKLFDKLPILAGTQSFIEGNRIVYGDIIEDYDNVKVDADLNVDYQTFDEADKDKKLNTIKGRIYIRNINEMPEGTIGIRNNSFGLFFNSSVFQQNQPIRFLNGDTSFTPYFGSVSTAFATISEGGIYRTEKDFLNDGLYYNPIPLAGFVVYLAGTPYKTVSKQHRAKGSIMSSTNVYFVNKINMEDICLLMRDNKVYSEFELTDIPDGEYTIRIASHLTTKEELEDVTRPYENTSTFTMRVGGVDGGECRVKVQGGEIKVIGDTEIADITYPEMKVEFATRRNILQIDNRIIYGYLFDGSFETITTTNQIRQQNKIAYAKCNFEVSGGASRLGFYGVNRNYVKGQSSFFFTDYNGFFFCKNPIKSFKNVQVGTSSTQLKYYNGSVSNLIQVTQVLGTDGDGIELLGLIDSPTALELSRTKINGKVIDDNGSPVPNMLILAENGDRQITDAEGNFSIRVYANSFYNFINNFTTVNKYIGTLFGFSGIGNVSYLVEDNVLTNIDINLGVNPSPLVPIYNDNIELNLPDITVLTVFGLGKSFLKRGASYEFGIIYFDRANRSGAVNTSDDLKLELPFFTEKVKLGLQSTSNVFSYKPLSSPIVSGYIKHKPPKFATHYCWARTKRLSVGKYIQFITKSIEFKEITGQTTSQNDAYTIDISIDNIINGYNEINKGSKLVYSFTQGDRVRFIKSAFNFNFEGRLDLEILSFDIGTNVITIRNNNSLPLLSISGGDLIEIYTPSKNIEEKLYFEFGEFYEIGNAGTDNAFHKGNIQDQTDTLPAIVEFSSGDTYLFKRNMPIENNLFKNEYVESIYVNDFVNRSFITTDLGRPNIVNQDIKQIRRPTTIYYSDRFIPETAINGLNSFYDINFEQYDRQYGSIQRLHSFNKRLDCYQELKVGQILVEENVMFDQFDRGNVATSEKVLSKIVYYTGEYGIGLNPESFSFYGNRRYFVDYRRGVVCRLSNDGISLLSDIKMKEFFEDKFNEYLADEIVPTIFTSFDVSYSELVVAFGGVTRSVFIPPIVSGINFGTISYETKLIDNTTDIEFDAQLDNNKTGFQYEITTDRDIARGVYIINANLKLPEYERKLDIDIKPITLAFSEETKHWTSFYSFTPEFMCTSGLDIVTFKNGQLFLHDQSNTHCNFYGIQNQAEVWIPFNVEPTKTKFLKSIVLHSTSPFDVIIETLNGQMTTNDAFDFIDEDIDNLVFNGRENVYYAHVWRDVNTVNEEFPKLNGDVLRDRSFLVKLITNSTRKEIVYQLGLNQSLSERTSK